MKLEAIWHQALSHYASALDERTLMIRIRTGKDDIKVCDLYYGDRAYPRNPILMFKQPMTKVASDECYDYYETELESDYTRVCYYFHLKDDTSEIYYMGGRFKASADCNRVEYFQFPYIHRDDIADIPKWAKEMVMYQIFPDSFATSHQMITGEASKVLNSYNEYSVSERGGTLRGIIENIDYIAGLGVNCLYLNPIFVSGTYHKYDIIDYFDIDPCLGDKETFRQLVKVCHDRGIRIILDGVFNHSSSNFFAFKDVRQKEEASPYKGWYYDVKFPVEYKDPPNYQAFAYVKEMPKLNTGNEEVVDYFCKVGTYWIEEMDIDGWRLDVANEINHDFWRAFRKRVRSIKKDAILIGEVWEESEPWLNGDQFDSTMNYRFSNICREFFGRNEYSETKFSNEIISMLMRYQKNVTYAQMNLLDSHDVSRFLFDCNEDTRKLILASVFQMTFVGAPSIYYGDEVFISGETEREYRKPMIWQPNAKEQEGIECFKRLILLRKSSKAFTEGSYRVKLLDDEKHIMMYERAYANEQFLVILHNSSEKVKLKLMLKGEYEIVFDTYDKEGKKVDDSCIKELDAYSAVVLKKMP